MILSALLQQSRRLGLDIRENTIAIDLVRNEQGRVVGVFALDFVSGGSSSSRQRLPSLQLAVMG